jgi:formiminoglutamate deiminase
MTADDIEAISAFAFMEMLEAGFTRVGEFHYVHHDRDGSPFGAFDEASQRVAAAAAATGIALTLLPVFYAHSTFGGAAPVPGQRRFISGLDRFSRIVEGAGRAAANLPDANIGVAPHSLRAVTPEELAAVVAIAGSRPIHMHVAEQVKEVVDCLSWSGRRPVEWLLDNAPLDPRWCLIHATHMTAEETERLALTGAAAGFCPLTEASLGDGIANVVEWTGYGGAFGIGTDSNILIGAADELRQLEYGQRLKRHERNILTGPDHGSTGRFLFDASGRGGMQALGRTPPAIAVGAPADLVVFDRDHPTLAGRKGDQILDAWIFAGRDMINTVYRRGRRVVEDGRHVERPAIATRYRTTLRRLLHA